MLELTLAERCQGCWIQAQFAALTFEKGNGTMVRSKAKETKATNATKFYLARGISVLPRLQVAAGTVPSIGRKSFGAKVMLIRCKSYGYCFTIQQQQQQQLAALSVHSICLKVDTKHSVLRI